MRLLVVNTTVVRYTVIVQDFLLAGKMYTFAISQIKASTFSLSKGVADPGFPLKGGTRLVLPMQLCLIKCVFQNEIFGTLGGARV